MADEQVRLYINESISGNPGFWPMDWFSRQYSPRFARALSIGCGTGALERDLLKRGICDRFDAFDGSPVSLDVAKTEAAKLGLSEHIHYSIADFNEPKLPRRAYNAVFFQQSAHHVAKLEKLFRAVLRSLKPGGVLYLDEYIGPSRSDWNDRLLGPLRSINKLLPEEVRTRDDLPLPIQWDDPSEAIRSAEILPSSGSASGSTPFVGTAATSCRCSSRSCAIHRRRSCGSSSPPNANCFAPARSRSAQSSWRTPSAGSPQRRRTSAISSSPR
ncbi:MAG: class I SAM-dependent methyltransferase [Thermoanaerobaculia bacterium]